MMGSTADVALRGARCATLIAKSAKIKEGKPHVFMICVDGSKAAKKAVNLACGVAGPKDTVVIVHAIDRSSQPTIGKPFRAEAVKASFAALVESDVRERAWWDTCGIMTQLRGMPAPSVALVATGLVARAVAKPGTERATYMGYRMQSARSSSVPTPTPTPHTCFAPSATPPARPLSQSRVKYEEIDDDNSEPISELLSDHAYDLECDFLVMGADGMGSFMKGQAHFGSVTEALIGKARCHVLVTKEEGKKYPIRTSSEYQLGFIGRGVDRVDTGGGSAGEAAVAKGKGPPAGGGKAAAGGAASEDAEGGDPGAKEGDED